MSAPQPLVDAIRRARGAESAGFGYVEVRSDDLALLVGAAVRSLAFVDTAEPPDPSVVHTELARIAAAVEFSHVRLMACAAGGST